MSTHPAGNGAEPKWTECCGTVVLTEWDVFPPADCFNSVRSKFRSLTTFDCLLKSVCFSFCLFCISLCIFVIVLSHCGHLIDFPTRDVSNYLLQSFWFTTPEPVPIRPIQQSIYIHHPLTLVGEVTSDSGWERWASSTLHNTHTLIIAALPFSLLTLWHIDVNCGVTAQHSRNTHVTGLLRLSRSLLDVRQLLNPEVSSTTQQPPKIITGADVEIFSSYSTLPVCFWVFS